MLNSQQDALDFPTGGACQQQGELIAAQACDGVFGPQAAPEGSGEMQQGRIASRVTMAVVDPLEIIQVDHHAGEHHGGLLRMPVTGPPETSPVEQCRQVVLMQCPFGLGERQLQLDDAAGQFGATAATEERGQHDLAMRTNESSP
ncbi:hypothetical protein BA022_08485 [Diaphorobacter nitroreducens]|nr:hypothetical protein BA022_08485 [Diaphorobacter nitroreducens]